jgi:hypothetical protein
MITIQTFPPSMSVVFDDSGAALPDGRRKPNLGRRLPKEIGRFNVERVRDPAQNGHAR